MKGKRNSKKKKGRGHLRRQRNVRGIPGEKGRKKLVHLPSPCPGWGQREGINRGEEGRTQKKGR